MEGWGEVVRESPVCDPLTEEGDGARSEPGPEPVMASFRRRSTDDLCLACCCSPELTDPSRCNLVSMGVKTGLTAGVLCPVKGGESPDAVEGGIGGEASCEPEEGVAIGYVA